VEEEIMRFAIISPTEGLERFSTRSEVQMVLAHQFVKDYAYAKFYLERKRQQDFIFLDNGAYEGAYESGILLGAMEELKPHVTVLPDVICNRMSTRISLNFLREFGHLNSFGSWMFIPQGDNLFWWEVAAESIPDFLELDPKLWLGLTRFLPTHVDRTDPLVRVKEAKHIHDKWPSLPIHCMGMADGDLNELEVLKQQGIIESCDSSAPVWRGWNDVSMTERDVWRKEGKEVRFDALLTEANLGLIEENLEVVFDACGGVQNRPGSKTSD
jgi:hypothetical protein